MSDRLINHARHNVVALVNRRHVRHRSKDSLRESHLVGSERDGSAVVALATLVVRVGDHHNQILSGLGQRNRLRDALVVPLHSAVPAAEPPPGGTCEQLGGPACLRIRGVKRLPDARQAARVDPAATAQTHLTRRGMAGRADVVRVVVPWLHDRGERVDVRPNHHQLLTRRERQARLQVVLQQYHCENVHKRESASKSLSLPLIS